MKFLKHYWWFVALLLVCALLLLQRVRSNKLNIKQFSIPDIESIDGFFIGKGADSISVVKTKNGWVVNNGSLADVNAVNSLFNVFRNLTTESPVPAKLNDSIVDVAENKGVQVIVYSNGSAKLSFSALFEANFKKTIFVEHNSRKAFFVELVGFTGQISDLFITEKSYWTGNQLFSFVVSKVSRIEVDIPQNPELSYVIGIDENKFELLRKSNKEVISNPNIDRISRLVNGLGNLTISKLTKTQQDSAIESIKSAQPMRIITLFTGSQSSRVILYPIKIDKINELGVMVEFDPNRFYVVYADNQVAEGTYVNFSSVLWDIADLVVKN
ncbi:MAG: hypothetical protein AB7S48_00185 [Bacteroidales bacterium]